MAACGLRGYGACQMAKGACMRSCLRSWIPVKEGVSKSSSSTSNSNSSSATPARSLGKSREKVTSVRLKALSWNILAEKFAAGTCATNLFAASTLDKCTPTKLSNSGSVGVSKLVPLPGKEDILGQPGSLPGGVEYWRWSHRFNLLKEELVAHGAVDLIALQEVDQYDDINQYLSKKGFGGIFGRKCPMGNVGNASATDGCAIFYRTSTLRPLDEFHLAPLHVGGGVHIALFQRFVPVKGGKNNKENTSFLAVATHLKAGEPLDTGISTSAKTRLLQSEELLKLVATRRRKDEPVVLFGDMNAHTINLESNEHSPTLAPWFSAGFRSAYDIPKVDESDDTQDDKDSDFSYWSYSRQGSTKSDVVLSEMKLRVDHVLVSGPRVSITKRLSLPPDKLIAPFEMRLPNQFYPSDHVSLGVEFDLQL